MVRECSFDVVEAGLMDSDGKKMAYAKMKYTGIRDVRLVDRNEPPAEAPAGRDSKRWGLVVSFDSES